MSLKIETWNEWDPLEAVIVGTAVGARVPKPNRSQIAIGYADQPALAEKLQGDYPRQVLAEAEEDLEKFCTALRSLGIEVYRPDEDFAQWEYSSPDWEAESQYRYCPRDSVLVHGDRIVEAPMPSRARAYEPWAYRKIFLESLATGSQWVSAPRPRLLDEDFEIENVSRDKLTLREIEPCFDAANVLRCGRDLFYLVSNSANKLGARWLANFLGREFRVHVLENIYSYMHLDSTISFLRPGLVLLNPERIRPDTIPEPLKSWDVVWCPPPVDISYYGQYRHASPWIGMNLLMVNPRLAVVEERQTDLIRALERQGIEVLPLPCRHARSLGGSFHCVTLDLRRKGTLESYF